MKKSGVDGTALMMSLEDAADMEGYRVRIRLAVGDVIDGIMQKPNGDFIRMKVKVQDGPNPATDMKEAEAVIPPEMVAWYMKFSKIETVPIGSKLLM